MPSNKPGHGQVRGAPGYAAFVGVPLAAQRRGVTHLDDESEAKATLPPLLAIERSGPLEAEFWERAVGRLDQTEADFRRTCELIIGTGALEATPDFAADYAEQAKAALKAFPPSDWKTAMQSLAGFAVSRTA